MNEVVITKCIECGNWSPADSYGNGVYCDELDKVVEEVDAEIGIPDVCPKLPKQIVGIREPRYDEVFFHGLDELNKISSEDIPIEFLKIIDDHFDEPA